MLQEYSVEMANVHAALLAKLAKQGFDELQIKPFNTDLIAVATGPGSFTGLRIGLSYAKGLSYGLQKPIIGVSNFRILAQSAPPQNSKVVTLIDARRGNWYMAIFSGGKKDLIEKKLIAGKELSPYLSDDTIIVANQSVPGIENLHIIGTYGAGTLCQVGLNQYLEEGPDSLDALEPLYLQPFAGVL